jgi:hypothetical protein
MSSSYARNQNSPWHTSEVRGTYGAVENLRGSTKVERTASRISVDALAQEVQILELVTEERSGNVKLLAANNYDVLAREQLLCDLGRQTTKEMTLGIDHNHLHKL